MLSLGSKVTIHIMQEMQDFYTCRPRYISGLIILEQNTYTYATTHTKLKCHLLRSFSF